MSGYTRYLELGAYRSDAGCGFTTGSGVVTDSHCVATDVGLAVRYLGNIIGAVGTVNPGVSFTLANGGTAVVTLSGVTVELLEYQVRWVPHAPRRGKRWVGLCHADTLALINTDLGGALAWADPANTPNQTNLAAVLASAGFNVFAGDFGGPAQFGADPAPKRVYDAWQVAITRDGVASDGIVAVVTSMGGTTISQFAREYPGSLKAVYGLIAAFNAGDIYTNNRGGLAAAVGAPWGVTPPTALPAHADPMTDAATVYAGVPGVAAYGGQDTIITPAATAAWCAASGFTVKQIDNTLNHSDALVGMASIPDIAAFLIANGA